jgi:Flp pilus assembly protein TadG
MGHRSTAASQAGATAIEFAFVLPLMFLLFYGALTYGLIFLLRLGLQHAAEDGARAALRYPAPGCAEAKGAACNADEEAQYQYAARLQAAYTTANARAAWMLRDGENPLGVVSRICQDGFDCGDGDTQAGSCGAAGCAPSAPPDCQTVTCQIVVTVRYDYAAVPFIPTVPGFGLVTPAALTGQGRLLLDSRGFSP